MIFELIHSFIHSWLLGGMQHYLALYKVIFDWDKIYFDFSEATNGAGLEEDIEGSSDYKAWEAKFRCANLRTAKKHSVGERPFSQLKVIGNSCIFT